MDESAVLVALDQAITRVATEEFDRLSEGLKKEDLSCSVYNALESFSRLKQGISPDYDDPWVALFYLTWYQPRHIYLAYQVIDSMRQTRGGDGLVSRDSVSLRVVDFGCGALAMLFAVVWATANALENDFKPQGITVYSYDPSKSMVRLGNTLWKTLKRDVRSNEGLKSLSKAFALVKVRCGDLTRFGLEARRSGEERWLTALHTTYASNQMQVKEVLAGLADRFDPTTGIMTCHTDGSSKWRLGQASPFEMYDLSEPNCQTDQTPLPEISKWRRSLIGRVDRHQFLEAEVSLSGEAYAAIYTRPV